MRFLNYKNPYSNQLFNEGGAGDGGAGDGGAGDPPPATTPPAMNLETASKFVTNNGGFVFGNQVALDEHIQNNVDPFTSDAKKSVYARVDENVNSVFGTVRNENEQNADYLKRASSLYRDKILAEHTSGDGSAELNAARNLSKTANDRIKVLEQNITDMKSASVQSDIQSQMVGAMGKVPLAYQGIELNGIHNEIQSQFNKRFTTSKDDRGFIVTDTVTGEAVLNADGTRKGVADVMSSFVGTLEGLRMQSGDGGGQGATAGAQLPDTSGGGGALSEAESKVLNEQLNKEAAKNGWWGSERKYWEHAKSIGLPIPEHLKEQWKL